MQKALPAISRLELTVLMMLCAGTWALSHGYAGLFHDSGLYTLQALSRLDHPSLAEDVFLKFGSQDRFTIFSPLYAALARWSGMEAAAAALTFVFQMAVMACAYRLARAVMPARAALYGVAVLIAMPGDYGADRVFDCVESFLTPRMAAEALVLASLAAALSGRRPLALVLAVIATLMHPIMAGAGIAALLVLYVAIPKPRLGAALAAAGGAALLAVAWGLPKAAGFDAEWLRLVVDRSPYLFVTNWQWDDWARVAVTLATLGFGAFLPGERVRTLSLVALVTTVAGLGSTFLACDELHLVLLTQLQPWRWQWLGTVVAALVLPVIASTHWPATSSGRTVVLLLGAAWIFGSNTFALTAAVAAVGCLAIKERLSSSHSRLVFWGACGLLAIAVIWRLASNLEFTEAHYLDANLPLWLRRAMSFTRDGILPLALMALTWWLADASRPRWALMPLAALMGAACVVLLPHAWSEWSARQFPAEQQAQFAPWRELLPPKAQVFWPESPLATWMLLERPSYLSVLQTSGMVFSRQTALELANRAHALSASISPVAFLGWASGTGLSLSLQQLTGVCNLAVFDYLVTSGDLGFAPEAVLPRSAASSMDLRLYRCRPAA